MKSKIKTVFYWLFYSILSPLSFIFFLMIVVLKPVIDIRITPLLSHRFGHLCLNPAIFFFEKKKKKENSLDLFFTHRLGICNSVMFNFWSKKINIFPNILLKPTYDIINFFNCKKIFSYVNFSNKDRDIDYLIQKNKKISILNNIQKKNCQNILKNKGFEKKKFVCLFIRDDNYLKKYGKKNWNYLSHKNVDINLFKSSIKFLIKKKYLVLRMGAAKGKKILIKNNNFYDYANSKMRSEEMDIYLSDNCEFCIQTGTGGAAAAQLFKKPTLEINTPPHQLMTYLKNSELLTKHLYSKKKGKFLSLKELMKYDPYSMIKRDSLEEKGIKIIENTSKEILESVKEITYRMQKKWRVTSHEKKLKKRFNEIFDLSMINSKSQLKFHGNKIKGNFSLYFMKKNKYWLN